jgi:glyoxylase-like metal-dependent hydrolase (beta-lactamase superfamily II)
MAEFVQVSRRLFLARLGKGTMALAVLGACGDGGAPTTAPPGDTASTTTTPPAETTTTAPQASLARYLRVNLGFVSAYVVVRGSEAAVVDTGVEGSEGSIEAALGAVDLGWDAVGDVILTHRHPDHVGSLGPVLEAASGATGYVGAGDLQAVTAPRALTPLTDGDEVFGLRVVATPGHTAGHISLLDSAARVLVAGDAINGAGNNGVIGPNPQFSENHDQALATVAKIAGLDFDTIYFGHGEPVTDGGTAKVAALAAGPSY